MMKWFREWNDWSCPTRADCGTGRAGRSRLRVAGQYGRRCPGRPPPVRAPVGGLARRPGAVRDVGEPARSVTQEESARASRRGLRGGSLRRGRWPAPGRVRPSLLASSATIPKPRTKRVGMARPSGGGPVAEHAPAVVVIERRRFAKEVGHGQIEPAVAVVVAAGHPHARKVAAARARRQPRGHSLFGEAKAAQVAEEVVGRRVVGHEQVDLAVIVEIGRDDSQAASVRVNDARLGRNIDEPAAVVTEEMVRQRRGNVRGLQ